MYSFDIFDTLITRRCKHSLGIWKTMENVLQKEYISYGWNPDRVCSFSKIRIEAERIASSFYKKKNCNIDQIYEVLMLMTGLDQQCSERLKQLEIRVEYDNAEPIVENIDKLKSLIASGEKVVLISDMFLFSNQIRAMLLKFDGVFENIPIYVSTEYDATKRSGSLYKTVSEKENADYHNWTHIGDNRMSDYLIPRQVGIKTKIFGSTPVFGIEDHAIDNSVDIIQTDNLAYDFGYNFGGPILYSFVKWLLDISLLKKINRLYFILRDGYVLKQIADKYIDQYKLNIETHYMYGSRKAWRVENHEEVERVKAYCEQVVDVSDENFAFVDLQGTGQSIERISEIMGWSPKVFYYACTKLQGKRCTNYTYSMGYKISIEVLGRAPHGATIGYRNDNGVINPVLNDDICNAKSLNSYKEGVFDFIKSLHEGNLLISDKEVEILGRLRYERMGRLEDNCVLEYVGNLTHNENNQKGQMYAPILSMGDIVNYIDNSDIYSGNNIELSVKRSSPEVQKYYRDKTQDGESIVNTMISGRYLCGKQNIIIYGAGLNGRKAIKNLQNNTNINIVAWADVQYEEKRARGYDVVEPVEAFRLEYDYVIVAISGNTSEIKTFIEMCGVKHEKIRDLCML